MDLMQWYQKAMSSDAYLEYMKENKERTASILEKFSIPEEDRELLERIGEHSLKVIAITEDWCGDAMVNIPILLKLAEAANIEVKMILRDENLELMDQYLTNGTSRSIPIFIIIDEEGKERMVWGPRAPMVKKVVDDENAKLPPRDHEDFPLRKKEMIQRLGNLYSTDRTIWQEVYDSLKTSLVQSILM
ncbi:thioredoxin family protein [Rossellomorea marisflavi]|uniref:thioredoxin family protein n=1 Tax=Rossellomorea marisflavi TaxID=189381 RepID=UPI0027A36003|nr:thioredoxin family protein [Rossellomorea marisflavi]UTE72582.1 thioredoxin family protein [Rossellomorea marisflavi]